MALIKLETDLNIISKLGTNPGVDDGLSEEQLKAKFDEAGNIIKNYINTTLIPNLNMFVNPSEGLSMTGEIRMNGNPLSGLPAPTDGTQAANKGYVDAAKAEAGAYTDAAKAEAKTYTDTAKAEANAYTDSRHITKTATITTTWSGSAAPYTQVISVAGISESDTPHITPVYSTTNATAIAQKEAWACVSKAVTAADKLTFTCFEDKPTTAIPIQIEVNR